MNSSLGFSFFEPSPPSAAEIADNTKRANIFQSNVKRMAAENGLVEAKSDYFGCDTYFIQRNTRQVYKVHNDWHDKTTTPVFLRPAPDEIDHILQLNGYK